MKLTVACYTKLAQTNILFHFPPFIIYYYIEVGFGHITHYRRVSGGFKPADDVAS